MSKALENVMEAQKYAMSVRPEVGGFPYLAEALRQAGISRNLWALPSCQSIYITKYGNVVMQGTPLVSGMVDIPKFNQGTNSCSSYGPGRPEYIPGVFKK